MKKQAIYREDGKLKINLAINKNDSMIELEDQIAELIESAKEEFTEAEQLQIKQQILLALKDAK